MKKDSIDVNTPINRGDFLKARMAYLASMRITGASYAEMRDACNIHDDTQVALLLATWDENNGNKHRNG